VEIECENAAFAEDTGFELSRLFNRLSELVFDATAKTEIDRAILDINGNKVGRIKLGDE